MDKPGEKTLKTCDIRAVLSWYQQMGIDTASAETPTNWLDADKTIDQSLIARARKKPRPNAAQSPAAAFLGNRKQPAGSRGENRPPASNTPPATERPAQPPHKTAPLALPSIELAKELAKNAHNLADLRAALGGFDGCGLKRTAKNLVFFRGAEQAHLMIIGEAPGRDEDLVGKPFVGRAGQLLDRILKAIDHDETNTHITNIVYWRPPGNRTPTSEEGAICRPFLDRQISLVKPDVILFLGGAAAKQIYDTPVGITKLRGKWKDIQVAGTSYTTMATLHPAYLLRTPIAKRLVWQDVQQIAKKLKAQ